MGIPYFLHKFSEIVSFIHIIIRFLLPYVYDSAAAAYTYCTAYT